MVKLNDGAFLYVAKMQPKLASVEISVWLENLAVYIGQATSFWCGL